MALTKTQISELYVSIFNRASEKSGSQNWLNSGYNTDATTMANAMLATDAAKTYFGTSLVSDAAFVEHIYANTLNKGGATVDAAGKAGWVEFLATGKSRGEMVAKMIEAIKEYQVGGAKYATADQTTKDAAQQFDNRVKVSDYTADTLETIAVSEIDSKLSFSSALTVTSDAATIASAKATIDATNPANVGKTFTLTTGVDDGAAFVGTAGIDTFNANLAFNTTTNTLNTVTLNSLDVLDGKGGVDTLNFYSNDAATVPLTGTISNIENINIISGAGVTVATSSTITGVENISAKAIGGAVSIGTKSDVKSVTVTGSATTVTINDAGTAGATTADKIATVSVSGNSGAVTIGTAGGNTLDSLTTFNYTNASSNADINAAAGTRDLTLNLNKITGGIITDATATGLTVNNTGAASTLTIAAAAAKAITLNADEKLTLTALNDAVVETMTVKGDSLVTISGGTFNTATLKSIDASASTGGISIANNQLNNSTAFSGSSAADTISIAATTKTISMGAGDDTVTMTVAVGTNGSVDAGEGVDTLVMTAANAATASADDTFEKGISNFEKVSIGQVAQTFTNTINMANLDDINYLVTAGTAAATVAQKAVYTMDLTGIVIADGATFSIGGTVAHTAAASSGTAGGIATALNGTQITVSGVVYDINATNPAAVTLTQVTAATDAIVTPGTDGFALTVSAGANATDALADQTTAGIAAVAAGALTVTNIASNGTVELTGAINAASSVSVKDSSTNGTDVLNVRLNGTANIVNTGTLTVANVETINITATDSSVDTVTLNNPSAVSKINLVAVDATKIVVAGNHGVDFTGSNLTKVTTLDASGVVATGSTATATAAQIATAGAVTFASTVADKAVTVTTGNGADVIDVSSINGAAGVSATFLATNVTATTVTTGEGNDQITGSAGKDIINAGAGNDTITGGAAADTITTGTGNDTIVLTANTDSTLTNMDVITDFTANTYGNGANGAAGTGANADTTKWNGDVLKINVVEGTISKVDVSVQANASDAQTFIQNIGDSTTDTLAAALDSSTGKLYVDFDSNGTIDSVIQLTGVTTITEAAIVLY